MILVTEQRGGTAVVPIAAYHLLPAVLAPVHWINVMNESFLKGT
jgi:hypothetical protein